MSRMSSAVSYWSDVSETEEEGMVNPLPKLERAQSNLGKWLTSATPPSPPLRRLSDAALAPPPPKKVIQTTSKQQPETSNRNLIVLLNLET